MNKFKNNRTLLTVCVVAAVILIIVVLLVVSGGRRDSESLALNSSAGKSNGEAAGIAGGSKPVGDGNYDYTEAVDHIGEKATVTGTVQKVFTSKSGTVFFDYCDNFQTCTFSAVIFASDLPKFKDITQYEREVKVTGLIKSYQGKAEIILSGPEQIE